MLAASLLFGMLAAVRSAFDAPPSAAGVNRLVVSSRISIIQSLPQSLLQRIQTLPGVKDVAYANWFGGYYQDPKNQQQMFQIAINPAYLDVYPEVVVSAEQRKAFESTRTGALIGEAAANSKPPQEVHPTQPFLLIVAQFANESGRLQRRPQGKSPELIFEFHNNPLGQLRADAGGAAERRVIARCDRVRGFIGCQRRQNRETDFRADALHGRQGAEHLPVGIA